MTALWVVVATGTQVWVGLAIELLVVLLIGPEIWVVAVIQPWVELVPEP